MFNPLNIALSSLLFLALPALSAITPTSPDGNTVIKVGDNINALWTADSTGTWTDVEIQLMTGDNLQMIPLATLATGIDGTTSTSLEIPCPDVTPYSKIYFLQFTLGGDVSTSTWTTRFTIAGADDSTVAPTNSTNYSGTQVEWGTGALTGQAPTVITGATSSNSTSATTSSSGTSTTIASANAAVSSASDDAADASSTGLSVSASTSASASASGSATRASAAPASSSGAALRKSTVGLGAVVLGLAGIVAL